MKSINIEEYREYFSGSRGVEALKLAHDIRKFEIDLYWKRAAYFWTFIAAAFAGYFAIQKDGDVSSIFIVSCLGFTFSLGWYFVNRGSGAWQRNWEGHVDLLEDQISGPLHKTLIDRDSYTFWHFVEPYSFSPSRINNILALYVTFIWLFLIVRSAWKAKHLLPITVQVAPSPKAFVTISVVFLVTLVGAICLFCKGRSNPDKKPRVNTTIRQRTYEFPTRPV